MPRSRAPSLTSPPPRPLRPRRPWSLGVGLALVLAGAVAAEDPQRIMDRGEAAYERGDVVGALASFREAAEAGYPPAQVRLAYLLDNSEENAAAVRWYREAAEGGYPPGQHGLAEMYAKGEGVDRDLATAHRWFEQAAAQGHLPAIRVLAVAYERGELDLRVDYDRAVHWLQAGADAGDPWSVDRLARAYERGQLGRRIDLDKALRLRQGLPREQR